MLILPQNVTPLVSASLPAIAVTAINRVSALLTPDELRAPQPALHWREAEFQGHRHRLAHVQEAALSGERPAALGVSVMTGSVRDDSQ